MHVEAARVARRNAADSHRHPVVAWPRGPIGDAALVTSRTPTSLLLRARLARDALLRRLPAGAAAPIDPVELYARVRDAERYRDRLPVGSEREGAEEMLRRLRSAYATVAVGQDAAPPAAHVTEGRGA